MKKNRRYIFGTWQETDTRLSVADAEAICLQASRLQKDMRELGTERVYQVLSRLKAVWKDPESSYRKRAEEVLPSLTGFSAKMIRLGLEELGNTLDPEVLELKLKTELNGIPRSPLKDYDPETRRFLCFEPLGTLFHVLSGNVFLVGPGSLLEGVLTGNVNIFKMSSSDTFFLPLFVESLESVDPEKILVSKIAVLDVSSSQAEVLEVFKKNVDGVVVWGGEEAAQSFRQGLPARVRFVMFGPKLSFSVVTQDGWKSWGVEEIARSLAYELVIWDQNACTAPQLCLVQGRERRDELAKALAVALKTMTLEFPAGRASSDAAAEIRKLRGVAEIAEARGQGRVLDSGLSSLDYTILVEEELKFETSPLQRTIRLMAYEDFSQVVSLTQPFKGYLQTVGIAGTNEEIFAIEERLGLCGAQRVLPLGQMSGGGIDDPHDGAYDLPQLMNLVVGRTRANAETLDAWDLMPQAQRQNVQNEKFRRVLRNARKTKFYGDKIPAGDLALDQLSQLPTLDRGLWEKNMLPESGNLQSRSSRGGYVTRSGGTLGTPKYSYFDKEDWSTMIKSAARMFRACGFSGGDRVANLLSSGDLYGSFISFDHVSFELGTQNFVLGSNVTADLFLEVVNKFDVNVVIGFPPKISSLCREVKQRFPDFKLEKIMYAGQPMSQADQDFLRKECGVKIIASVIGSTESNHLAYQCPELHGNRFHLTEDYNWIEILDAKNQPVPTGESGKIAITNLEKTNFPVLRFLNGDGGRILAEKCSCGRQDRVLEYLGRLDDIICIGLMNVSHGAISEALYGVPALAVQIVGSFKNGKDTLRVRVEFENPATYSAEMVKKILIQQLPTLAEACTKAGLVLEVESLAAGKLERNPRTGKIRGVIDER